MALFGHHQPADKTQPKKRSTFATLFAPNVGDSIRPMGESLSVFVTMIAMIFAMNGLFPKNHPALTGKAEARLSLREILDTAWNGLSFTKQGVPKILLFFAVAGGIVLSILSIVTALLLGFIGHAHAASPGTGAFTLSNADTDIASNWLNFLFNPDTTTASTAATHLQNTPGMPPLPSNTIQAALATALGYYSGAILVIAAFLLFYHLTAMVAETAQHGVPMGKRASQIWAPIRLVVAIGLLVPVNGTLNSGQYIVLQMAQWGSALATNVWTSFVGALAANTQMPPLTQAGDVSTTVANLAMMYACEYSYNYQITQVTSALKGASPSLTIGANDLINQWGWSQTGTPAAPTKTISNNDGSTTYSFTNKLAGDYNLCGSYTIPAAPQSSSNLTSVAAAVYKGTVDAFNKANSAAAGVGTEIQQVMYFSPSSGITAAGTYPSPTDIQTLATGYQNDLKSALSSALSGTSFSDIMSAMQDQSTKEGWIAAGAWFNQLSSIESEINSYEQNSLPSTNPPDIGAKAADSALAASSLNFWNSGNRANAQSAYTHTSVDLWRFQDAIISGSPTKSDPTSLASPASGWSRFWSGASSPLYLILSIVEGIAEWEHVWGPKAGGTDTSNNGLSLGVQFKGQNPLMEMAAFGHNAIGAAVSMINIGIVTSGIGGAVSGKGEANSLMAVVKLNPAMAAMGVALKGLGAAVSAVGTALLFLGAIFFTMGAAMAFVIPLLPFMHFFFNTITWVACVAECLLGIPLVALAHLNPEGDGLPGPSAKGAYYMIFSVLLRPVMMIFGLIIGLLILIVAAGLLNALYATAVAGSGSLSTDITGAHLVISRIMFSVIYVALLYSVANHAFALIGRFPDHAMSWMGAQGLSGQKMGDPGHIATGVSLASGYVAKEGAQKLGSMAGGIGQAAGVGRAKMGAARNEIETKAKGLGKEYGQAGKALPAKYEGNPYVETGHDEGTEDFRTAKAKEYGRAGKDLPPEWAGNPQVENAHAEGREAFNAEQALEAKRDAQHEALLKAGEPPPDTRTTYEKLRDSRSSRNNTHGKKDI